MKTFIINKAIEDELVADWIKFKNEYYDEDWEIIVDCVGGSMAYTRVIANDLNKKADKCTMIFMSGYSAGLYLFYFCDKCNRRIVLGARGMIHLSYSKMEMDSRGKVCYKQDLVLMRTMKDCSHKEVVKIGKDILSPKRNKKLLNGEDVWLTYKQLIRAFPNVQII